MTDRVLTLQNKDVGRSPVYPGGVRYPSYIQLYITVSTPVGTRGLEVGVLCGKDGL